MTARERKIEIEVGSGRIAGTLITPGILLPGVLFVHGWGGSQEQYLTRAREVAALGSVCLTFDLGGHAGTQPQRETVSRESNLRDLLAAYDALAAHPDVDPGCMAVVGSSYGGYLAAILTTLRSVTWMGLRAPALYIDTGWELPKLQLHKEHDLRAYRLSFVAAASNRALRACVDFKGDVLVVESGHDDYVPPAVIKSYREACLNARSLTYRCLADADHGLSDDASQRAYSGLLVQWLGEMFAGSRRAPPPGPPPAETVRAEVQPEAPPKPS